MKTVVYVYYAALVSHRVCRW